MFFGVSMQSEHELSAFFHETDQEAKNLQEHMELQEFREQMDQDLGFRGDVPLPTEVGISTLPNGAKILTIKRPKARNSKIEKETNGHTSPSSPDGGMGPLPEDEEPKDSYDEEEDEAKAQEMELVHIPLHRVARQIWEYVPGEDWLDEESNQMYKQTFTGKAATQYLLDAGFAPDGEEAVDYLALIMDEIGAFMRVDSGKEQEFENEANAHYQWIHIPIEEQDEDDDEEQAEMDQDHVGLDDILIGFRHSYGGYHRLLKQYRLAGVDPTAVSAAQKAQVTSATPISEVSDKEHIREKSNSPEEKGLQDKIGDKFSEIPQHIRQQSQKLLKEGILKLKKGDSNKRPAGDADNGMSPISVKTDVKSPTIDDLKAQMDDSDDDMDDNGTVIVLGPSNSNTRITNPSGTNTPTNTNQHGNNGSNGFQLSSIPKLTKIDSNSSDQGGKKKGDTSWNPVAAAGQNKRMSTKDLFGHKSKGTSQLSLKKGQGSLELQNIAQKYKPSNAMRKTQSNGDDSIGRRQTLPNNKGEEEDYIAPLKSGVGPGLPKAKSTKIIRAGGLKRSASSKNILLRHLDNRPGRNQL
eukprot:CAMPEP_0201596966 /NCGR_PEP_ID=MMETSP0190_2-20130828/193554_1 /ASSEMBLY_ACC=CAM_ASM_000263 /TAXON_ID=37353 /ORGANISM="Rosalina sp." /LENGTH=578 /DNA_ID=CAMNT_0048057655 /DNA_START=593 /DNA_END=2329 /DNA_ORIENTATION=-